MNPFTGISSVTTMRGEDGELKTVETNEWVRDNYRVNLQDVENDPVIQPLTEVSIKKPRRKGVSKQAPKQVGQELVEEAHQKDLKKRGLK